MSETQPTTWLIEAASSVPLRSETLFQQLWGEKRLHFRNGVGQPDLIDEANSRLAASTLERGKSLLIVLPDGAPQRPPVLFANALLNQWWDRKDSTLPPGHVVYFGSTVGIRRHLANAQVGNLSLDGVFPQSSGSSKAPRGRRRRVSEPARLLGYGESGTPTLSHLPEVVCSYSPADPVAVLQTHKPAWMAIDCAAAAELRWLPLLLEHSRSARIPIVAWSQNPLSETVQDFKRYGGEVLRWPHALGNLGEDSDPVDPGVRVMPIIIETAEPQIENSLKGAYYALARASQKAQGRLGRDAVLVAWSLQRALEGLSVPLGLYESEARNYWGVRRIGSLRDASARFVEAVQSTGTSLSADLEEVLSRQEAAMDGLGADYSPLWSALTQICMEDAPNNSTRLLVFSSAARKQLFAFALLARYNITEDDLKEVQVELRSLRDMRQTNSNGSRRASRSTDISLSGAGGNSNHGARRRPLLVGLPSARMSPRLLPVLSNKDVEVLIYPYQSSALAKRASEWNTALGSDPRESAKIILDRSGKLPPRSSTASAQRVELLAPTMISIVTGAMTTPPKRSMLWEPVDELDEVSWLLTEDESGEDETLGAGDSQVAADFGEDEVESVWVLEGFQVTFAGGWRVLFASDDSVNLIAHGSTGEKVEERHVRSLGPGDRVLFIHGQRRQSLYDLIISRVHSNPAIELHLALIRRWHEDLVQSYGERRRAGWSIEEVLRELQDRGSALTSEQTIRLWLRGQILAPEDPDDLSRLADAMAMGFVKQHHRRIFRAAQRIRGLHRGLSIRLNHWLRTQVDGLSVGNEAYEIFDQELGLSLQDFKDSLLVLRVETTQTVEGPHLRSTLGALEKEQV